MRDCHAYWASSLYSAGLDSGNTIKLVPKISGQVQSCQRRQKQEGSCYFLCKKDNGPLWFNWLSLMRRAEKPTEHIWSLELQGGFTDLTSGILIPWMTGCGTGITIICPSRLHLLSHTRKKIASLYLKFKSCLGFHFGESGNRTHKFSVDLGTQIILVLERLDHLRHHLLSYPLLLSVVISSKFRHIESLSIFCYSVHEGIHRHRSNTDHPQPTSSCESRKKCRQCWSFPSRPSSASVVYQALKIGPIFD
jgi:hypothetical protein